MGMRMIFRKAINKLLMKSVVNRIAVNGKTVFLTFDDGPEPEITEFVLNELDKYGMKATFFCVGENARKYPELMEMIKHKGHAIGNHTNTHRYAYMICADEYVKDVEEADGYLKTHLFRPPNGCLLLKAWWQLRKQYKIIYWTIGSGDWCKDTFDYERSMNALKETKSGDILLFHFSQDLQMGTRRLLPDYLIWLNEKGFKSDVIK